MAVPRCRKCGEQHLNFQRCDVAAAKRKVTQRNIGIDRLSPPEGFSVWKGDRLGERVKKYGNMIVETSDLPPLRTGKLTYPKEKE